jgi:lysophospholipase L1-like esterase
MYRFLEIKYLRSKEDSRISVLEDDELNIYTGFRPADRLNVLNLEDSKVREGLRLTLEFILRMSKACAKSNIDFIVALIPTKESVFADHIRKNDKIKHASTIGRLIAYERQTNYLMKKYFDQNDISYVDVLPDLRRAVTTKPIYPQSDDGHPNADGYRVIAAAIQKSLARRGQ